MAQAFQSGIIQWPVQRIENAIRKVYLMTTDDLKSDPEAYLVDLESNRKIPVVPPFCSVGRHDSNSIVFSDDKSMSKQHFVILFDEGKYSIEDSKSSYGTFVNGNKIDKKTDVQDGDVIKAGNSMFWFVIGDRELKVSQEFKKPD